MNNKEVQPGGGKEDDTQPETLAELGAGSKDLLTPWEVRNLDFYGQLYRDRNSHGYSSRPSPDPEAESPDPHNPSSSGQPGRRGPTPEEKILFAKYLAETRRIEG